MSALEASPLLSFSALGVWGVIFLFRNYFSSDAYYSYRNARFQKVHAPRIFLILTLLYGGVAMGFIAGPIWLVVSLATR